MQSTNRTWQNHLTSKGLIPFFLDRLKSHALSSQWQYGSRVFQFPVRSDRSDDELTRAFFEMNEDFPYEFYLEFTNTCNLNCKMCAREKMTRPQGIMSNDLFRRAIDEIAEHMPYAYLHFYGIGEPLMDPDALGKIAYACEKGLYNSILFTNGRLLGANELYKRVLDSGIAGLGIDLDGFSPTTYAQVRRGGDFNSVRDAIEQAYAYKRSSGLPVRIEVAYQIYPDINEHDVEPFIQWCLANDYEYKLVTMHGWAGLRDDIGRTQMDGLADDHHAERRNPCAGLWGGMFIAWDGRVGLCFLDADVHECMGDLNKKSLYEIWTGRHRDKRRRHVCGSIDGLCSRCTSFTDVHLPTFNSPLYPDALRYDIDTVYTKKRTILTSTRKPSTVPRSTILPTTGHPL